MAKKKPGEGPYHNNDGDPIETRLPAAGLSNGPDKQIWRKIDDQSRDKGGLSGPVGGE